MSYICSINIKTMDEITLTKEQLRNIIERAYINGAKASGRTKYPYDDSVRCYVSGEINNIKK